ncbi:hypothetical protein [Acinetobacter guillouiae]|uniref:hypothetical protein n=1 Tax=Acinetobacter guillouiae TaxID=106649 RepID=UPI0030084188
MKEILYEIDELNFDDFVVERSVIKSKGINLYVGERCYKKRNKNDRRFSNIKLEIDVSSIDLERCKAIKKYIIYIKGMLDSKNYRKATVNTKLKEVLKFLDFIDERNLNFNFKKNECLMILEKYKKCLLMSFRDGSKKSNSIAKKQNSIKFFFEIIFNDFTFLDRFNKVQMLGRINYNNKQIPSENDIKALYGVCEKLFISITDFLINFENYPLLIKFENIKTNHIWISSGIVSMQGSNGVKNDIKILYNHENNTLKSIEEFFNFEKYNSNQASNYKQSVLNYYNILRESNSNKYAHQRIKLANVALNAFLVMFVANTGINWAQLCEMEFQENLEYEKSSQQNFRAVKWRANNKICTYVIGTKFITMFKKFLKLREYVLNGREFKNMFFRIDSRNYHKLNKIVIGLNSFHSTLMKIDKDLVYINASTWRAIKGMFIVDNYDLNTASILLNNTEKVLKKNYINVNDKNYTMEIYEFFNSLEYKKIFFSKETVLGQCKSFNNYDKITDNDDDLDCNHIYSCLKCKNYIYTNTDDAIKKIIGFLRYLEKLKEFNLDNTMMRLEINDYINLIYILLDNIKKSSEEARSKIDEYLEFNEISDYWLYKIRMLTDLE